MAVDLVSSVSQIVFVLKLLGLWPTGNGKLYNTYTFLLVANIYLYDLSGVLYVFLNNSSLTEMAETIYNLLNSIAAGIKIIFFRRNFTQMKAIVDMLRCEELQSEGDSEILEASVKHSKAIFHFFAIMANVAIAQWMLFPILDKQKRLPSNAWFPYDSLSASYYSITYLWQCGAIFYNAIGDVCMDSFFPSIMLQIGAQCDILGDSISKLGEGSEEIQADSVKRCIKKHKLILKYTGLLKKAYENIIFVQITTSCLVFCETMFLLSLTKPFSAVFYWLISYQAATLTQLMLYCWYGNEVTLKSSKLDYYLFSSKWYEMPQPVKKDVLFFMSVLRKPIIIFVGSIFPVGLTVFSSIIQLSWTYFMAQHNLRKNAAV